jgi:hypothetical protein
LADSAPPRKVRDVNALHHDLPVEDESFRDEHADVLFVRGLVYALCLGALMWAVVIGLVT